MWGRKKGREIEGGEGGIARQVEGYGRGGGGERERERGETYGSFVTNVDLSNMKMNLIHN